MFNIVPFNLLGSLPLLFFYLFKRRTAYLNDLAHLPSRRLKLLSNSSFSSGIHRNPEIEISWNGVKDRCGKDLFVHDDRVCELAFFNFLDVRLPEQGCSMLEPNEDGLRLEPLELEEGLS